MSEETKRYTSHIHREARKRNERGALYSERYKKKKERKNVIIYNKFPRTTYTYCLEAF